jgi:hypothetical protein
VAPAYNPSYSGGRDQEDWGSKTAQAGKEFMRAYLGKTLSQKIRLVEWLKVKALSSSPSTLKKKRLKKLYKQNSISYKQSSVVESLPSLYRFCPALQKTKQSKQTNFCGNGPRAIKKKKKKKKSSQLHKNSQKIAQSTEDGMHI